MNWFKKEFVKLTGGGIHLMHEILNTKCKSLGEVYPSSTDPFSCGLSVSIDQWSILMTGYKGNETLGWPTGRKKRQ